MSIYSILLAILVFSFMVFFHELGHFLAARANGVGVVEFSVGMGPRLVSWGKGETKYSLKAIPFGGSCMMVGEDEDNPAPNAFNNKPAWRRFLVIFAGPFFNFVLAFLVSIVYVAWGGVNRPIVYSLTAGGGAETAGVQIGDEILSMNGTRIRLGRQLYLRLMTDPLDGEPVELVVRRGEEELTFTVATHEERYLLGITYYADDEAAEITSVTEGGAAEEAGLEAGDVITAINGTEIASGAALQEYFAANPLDGSEVVLSYERDGSAAETALTPIYTESESLGLQAYFLYVDAESAWDVIVYSFIEVGYWISYVFLSLGMLLTGQVGIREMSGPVGVVQTIGTAVEEGVEAGGIPAALLNLMMLMILLNANLGVLNLLPIPALDGGRLLFILIEILIGKPVPAKAEGYVHLVGFILLMILMVFLLFSDVLRLFGI